VKKKSKGSYLTKVHQKKINTKSVCVVYSIKISTASTIIRMTVVPYPLTDRKKTEYLWRWTSEGGHLVLWWPAWPPWWQQLIAGWRVSRTVAHYALTTFGDWCVRRGDAMAAPVVCPRYATPQLCPTHQKHCSGKTTKNKAIVDSGCDVRSNLALNSSC